MTKFHLIISSISSGLETHYHPVINPVRVYARRVIAYGRVNKPWDRCMFDFLKT